MVLVAGDPGSSGCPAAGQGKIHEMVESADRGKEKQPARKMGG